MGNLPIRIDLDLEELSERPSMEVFERSIRVQAREHELPELQDRNRTKVLTSPKLIMRLTLITPCANTQGSIGWVSRDWWDKDNDLSGAQIA